MKIYYSIIILLLSGYFSYQSTAQPGNDDCINAIDISYAFEGVCEDLNTIGPFDNTGATHSTGDPMVPSCFKDAPPLGNTTTMERSVWFKFTVPDIFGNGDNVQYDIFTSVSNSCDFENEPVNSFFDTQMVIYNAIFGCPNALTSDSTYIACNDDITIEPPFISGVEISLMPGQTYFILVDSRNAIEGEFCLDIAICGTRCGDNICSPNERYCTCTSDCVCSALLPQFACIFEDGFSLCGTNPEGDFIYCDTYFEEAPADHIYVGFAINSFGDCQNKMYSKAIVNYSAAKLYDADYQLIPSSTEISLKQRYFFEFSPADLNNGLVVDVITNTRLENGSNCVVPFEINTAEIVSQNSINCGTCVAGNVDETYNNQVVKEGGRIEVCTDGTENLNITCDSDDNDGFEYRWVVYANLDADNDFETPVTEPLEVDTCDSLPVAFLIDWFTIFTDDNNKILPPDEYEICGVALCNNTDGSTVKSCETKDCILITLTADAIKGCTDANACNYNEQATENDDSCILIGDTCNDYNANTENDLIDEDCMCLGTIINNPILGCTQVCFAEYNPEANEDDGSCETDLSGCNDVNAENFEPTVEEDCADFSLCVFKDSDGDSIPDYRENLNGNDTLEDDDTDADGIPNYMDDDDNGDGILTIDQDANGNGNLNDDDADNDGTPDYLDFGGVGIETYSETNLIQPNPNNGTFTLSEFWLNKEFKLFIQLKIKCITKCW